MFFCENVRIPKPTGAQSILEMDFGIISTVFEWDKEYTENFERLRI
jgi:hypothetical protein